MWLDTEMSWLISVDLNAWNDKLLIHGKNSTSNYGHITEFNLYLTFLEMLEKNQFQNQLENGK